MKTSKLEKKLHAFAAWYKLVRLCKALQMLVFVGLIAFALYILVDKLIFLQLDYVLVAASLGAVGTFVLLVIFLALPRHQQIVSYLVDRQAKLKNLISSGLEAEQQNGPVAELVAARAHDALEKQDVRRTMPIRAEWPGKFSFIPLLFVLTFLFLPDFDLLHREAEFQRKQAEVKRKKAGIRLIKEQVAAIKKHSRTTQSLNGKNITEDLKELERELMQADSPKEALAKLNSLEAKYRRELDKQRRFEASTRNLSARLNSKDLNRKSSDELKKLAANLRRNRQRKAAQNLRNLAQQMLSDELSEEEKRALARELAKVMDQFQGDEDAEKIAKLLKDMQNAPKPEKAEAGQNQSAPQAGQSASNQQQNKQSSSQAGKQQADSQQQTAKNQQNNPQQNNPARKQHGKNCSGGNCPGGKNCASAKQAQAGKQGGGQAGMNQSQEQVAGQLNQMADNMDQMNDLQQMSDGLQKAREEMTGKEFSGFDEKDVEKYLEKESQAGLGMQPGQGSGQGNVPGQGGGTGGVGQGSGGAPPEQMTATSMKEEMSRGSVSKGKILSQRFIYGVPQKGEAQKEYSNEVRAAREEALHSLAQTRVPREYEERVKRYFSSLEPQGDKAEE